MNGIFGSIWGIIKLRPFWFCLGVLVFIVFMVEPLMGHYHKIYDVLGVLLLIVLALFASFIGAWIMKLIPIKILNFVIATVVYVSLFNVSLTIIDNYYERTRCL